MPWCMQCVVDEERGGDHHLLRLLPLVSEPREPVQKGMNGWIDQSMHNEKDHL